MLLVARSTSNTTHTAPLKSRRSRAANSAGAKSTSRLVGIGLVVSFSISYFGLESRLPRRSQTKAGSHIMKQVLLGVTGIRAKVRFGESAQPVGAHAPAWKIKLPQRFHHPYVHRKRRMECAGKEQDTIRDFPADAGQLHQFCPGIVGS